MANAVAIEPVSAPNSLLTGKLTGNFAESGLKRRFSRLLRQLAEREAVFPEHVEVEFNRIMPRFSGPELIRIRHV